MQRIRKPRDVIDRKALVKTLDDLFGWSGFSDKLRPEVLAIFKGALKSGDAEIQRRFEAGEVSGLKATYIRSFLIDQIVRTLYDFASSCAYPVHNPTAGEQISLAAIGGYGRGHLAPHSDIDLMFLLPYKQTPHVEQVVEFMLYLMWDMGLKVGHSTRSVDDCIRLARSDQTIRTSLLDARWLWGNQGLFDSFWASFKTNIVQGSGPEFVDAKLGERDERHDRMGDTRYVLEPNIKDGKGGMRDLQTLFWIIKYLYGVDSVGNLVDIGVLTKADSARFKKARSFLWTVRCHLHYLAGRPEERLTFDVQPAIAARMNYTDRAGARGVERFMRFYFLVAKDVGDLTRTLCAVLEDQHAKRPLLSRMSLRSLLKRNIEGFKVEGERLNADDPTLFERDPVAMLRLFHVAQNQEMDIHPNALRLVGEKLKCIGSKVRKDPEANRLFLEMLTSAKAPGITLRRLNDSGVFGRFIPDFARVVAQMQYDMYHVYTVDEHTIRAIDILRAVEDGRYADEMPVSSKVIHELQSRRALYVAVLLHDIAKGRDGDHSVLGAQVAEKLCPRLGLSEEETETVVWLVRSHLDMSRTAFKRDLTDNETIVKFVELVQSPERLKLLILLTAVDIRAVGPNVWNQWKAGLLRDLYRLTTERLSGSFTVEGRSVRVENAKAALGEALAAPVNGETAWTDDEITTHLDKGYRDYWLNYDLPTHLWHASVVHEAEQRGLDLHIATRPDPSRDATDITVYTADHPGLFSKITGAMALSGAQIVDAKIVTLANGMALDTLTIQDSDGQSYDEPAKLERLWKRLESAVRGTLHPARELAEVQAKALPSRTRVFKVAPRVIIDNKASRTHTVVEVNGRNRIGFLHDVAAALTGLGLQIVSASITTYGERAVDVFYVKDVFGLKLDNQDKLKRVREKLFETIKKAEEPRPKTKRKKAG